MSDALRILQGAAPVMAVANFSSMGHAQACAELFSEAKIPAIQITLSDRQAWQMVKLCKDMMPFAKVGVGSVLSRRQMLRAADEADFAVSPGFSQELSILARKTLTPYIPGVATAGEIMAAMNEEHRVLSCFPAANVGGASLLQSLSAAFPDVTFYPAGGISATDYLDYLALEKVACVGGSWMVPSEQAITSNRDDILAMLRQIYG